MFCNVHESDSQRSQQLRARKYRPVANFAAKTICPRPKPAEGPVETTRLEHTQKPTRKTGGPRNPLHFPVQAGQPVEILDRELQFVGECWPKLPATVRNKIVALAAAETVK